MPDQLLADTDIEDALSEAYVWVVATHAGYVLSKKNFDRDGVDVTIEAGSHFRPKIDVQLKATINLGSPKDGVFRYPCPAKNYRNLVITTQTPRILVVLRLPGSKDEWISISHEELVIRYAAYWVNLKGHAPTENDTSITIDVPEENRLTVESLQALMEQSRTGAL